MTVCACKAHGQKHSTKLIAITGGPGAGKTAVLEVARRSFCEHVMILPEAASILFNGGFFRKKSLAGKMGSQRAIFHVQRELESIVIGEAEAAIALCDRGTIDGLAYWPGSETDFWKEVGSSREVELKRYAAVIHLRTPTADSGYNWQNPARIETAEEALALDQKIIDAWKGHPNHVVITSSQDFLSKAETALKEIKELLPECCSGHEFKF